MKNLKSAAPYFLLNLLCFYLAPLFTRDTASAAFVLLVLFPAATVVCSLAAATKAGFCWVYPIAIAALFLPSIFLYYNSSAWVYSLLFALLSLIGCFFGWLVFRFGQTGYRSLRR